VDSLLSLDYPKEKLEIIVVDDGSEDATPRVLSGLPVKAILRTSRSGAAACRNVGWQAAKSELIAFTDSDCRADAGWLKELVERMSTHKADAIGGLVKSAGTGSRIDRYEAVRSPLYSGKHEKEITSESAISYLPTCNLVIKREVLEYVSGFDLAFPLAVGEDVDLVWRIVDAGFKVLYTPAGTIVHNHRESLKQFVIRRAQYAASEAQLVRKHPLRGRLIVLPVPQILFLIFVAIGIVYEPVIGLGLATLALLLQAVFARRRLAGAHRLIGWTGVALALVRGHLGFLQYALWTISQYYVLPLLMIVAILGAISSLPLILAIGVLLTLFASTAAMAYLLDRPTLDPVSFIAIFCLEKLAFQAGAMGGCFKHGTPRTLLPRIRAAW
jgi:mycofactocin system glycosyltransferase